MSQAIARLHASRQAQFLSGTMESWPPDQLARRYDSDHARQLASGLAGCHDGTLSYQHESRMAGKMDSLLPCKQDGFQA
jgi:hypothetical protein